MALADAYALAHEYRAVITKHDGEDDAAIDADLLLMSRVIERPRFFNRFFNRDAANVTVVYTTPAARGTPPLGWAESENPYKYGTYSRYLYVDDFVSVTTIKIDKDQDGSFADETALAAADYILQPENAALQPEAQPYRCIYIPPYSAEGGFPAGTRVQAVGVRGWPAVPAGIKRFVIEAVGILRLESPRATRTIDAMDRVISTSKRANDLLDDLLAVYRRKNPIGATRDV